MPVVVPQNLIELDTFVEGYMPDAPRASVPPTGLLDSWNYLPDPSTGTIQVRPGTSFHSAIIDASAENFDTDGYEAHWLFYFEALFDGDRHKYLIAILTNNIDATAENSAFFVYDFDLANWKWKASFNMPHAGYEHWGDSASNVWYGGTGGIPMYSWDPSSDTFDADASAGNFKALVAVLFDISTERPYDFAFEKGDTVIWDTNSKTYSTTRSIRFEKWQDGAHYSTGDRVSRWADHAGGGENYWKSFKCLASHTAVTADNAPDTGTNSDDFWRAVVLDQPISDDGEASDDWFFVPVAAQSIIGRFYAYRLWLRRHDSDNWSWAQYSAPFKPEKNADIADLVFNPADWAPEDELDGDGGGWLNLREGDGDAIRAFQPYSTYLLIFKRWMCEVLSGRREATWNQRTLDPKVGTIGQKTVVVHDGLTYFLSPNGRLYVTDGSTVEKAPGAEKVRNYLLDRIQDMLSTDDDENWLPTLTSFRDFIYISLSVPDADPVDADVLTVAYHPETQSFWPLSLPILDACTGRIEGAEKMWFTTTLNSGHTTGPVVHEYDPDTDTGVDPDPYDPTTPAETAIPWRARMGWQTFGLARNDRRIRRTYALVENADSNVTLSGYRQFNDTAAYDQVRNTAGFHGIAVVEGQWMADARSVSFKLVGNGPAKFYGFGVDTQPRPRGLRYHTGGD